MNAIAEKTGGRYLNVGHQPAKDAFEKLKYQAYKYLGYKTSNDQLEVFPKEDQLVDDEFSMAIKNVNGIEELTLLFGYGKEVIQEYKIIVKPNSDGNPFVRRIWGQKKLEDLNKNKEDNKNEIIELSKSYQIISDFTSMIVLETAQDYLQYNITPPADLLEEYNRLLEQTQGKQIKQVDAEIEEDTRGNFTGGTISGTVIDEDGLPLPTATVILKGTTQGTTTDFDGNYSINANPGDILVYSFVGYGTAETTVGSSSKINIVLGADNLEEVVVTAQGIKREKKALGYSVSTVGSEDLEQKAESDVARVLSGKASGVQVTPVNGLSGSGTNVIVRNYSSITGNNQVLFIVDGVPYNNSTNAIGGAFTGMNGSTRSIDIDPNNIESVSVLKGLAATTMYGSEGRNGVILITTKAQATSGFARTSGGYSGSSSTDRSKRTPKRDLFVKERKVKAKYMIGIRNAIGVEQAYKVYLAQRSLYKNELAFYIDMYDFFRDQDNELANRILSNVAEVDFDNYELLRAFAYKLEENYHFELAAFIYERILELRPEDVQSYRDLALVYQNLGRFDEAYDILESIVTEKIYETNKQRRKFQGVQDISKREYVRLMNKMDKQMPFKTKDKGDVRIVIDWNHNDTDIDLHVIDPNREECYYGNSKTKIGGTLSRDMTQGFGPEEFMLEKAVSGEYFIKVNYYGDRDQKVSRPTFMKVNIFKNYGKVNEERQVKVIRLDRDYKNEMVAKVSF